MAWRILFTYRRWTYPHINCYCHCLISYKIPWEWQKPTIKLSIATRFGTLGNQIKCAKFTDKMVPDTRIEVFNSSGQRIFNVHVDKTQLGKIDIQTEKWRTGIYLVKITNEKFVTTQKIEIHK